MGKTAAKVLEDALGLDDEQRAQLILELLESFEGKPDADAEGAWAGEIDRRARRARSGEDPGTTWPVVRERIESQLKGE